MITVQFYHTRNKCHETINIEHGRTGVLKPISSFTRVTDFLEFYTVKKLSASGEGLQDIINKFKNIPYVHNQDRCIPQVWRGELALFIIDNLTVDWDACGNTK